MNKIKKSLLALMVTLLVFGMTGCGGGHANPTGIVKSLIENYFEGKEKKIRDCYGKKDDASEDLQKEIQAMISYIKAHEAAKLKIVDCKALSETDSYTYVYITYNLVMEDEKEFPCVGTYMVKEVDRKYYVVPTGEVTAEMSAQAITDYEEFMTTDAYKEYRRAYDTFIKEHPGYEEKIAGKLG
ncbi:MAG: hypothetical protein KBT01_01395 [Clostridiales bacterium]|nr:hypothetical protein [Candidatus Blautia equi]